MYSNNKYAGMLVTAIQVDADGFYVNDKADVQIIVATDNKTTTTVSMRQPDAIHNPIVYTNDQADVNGETYRLVFDQNNSLELTLKAIESKPELLLFADIRKSIMDHYTELANLQQLTPNQLKIFDLLHQANLKRFTVRTKAPATPNTTTRVKTPVATKEPITKTPSEEETDAD